MAVFGLLSLQLLAPRQSACICHSVNMEWGVKENCVAVIALKNCRKSQPQIFELLTPLKISQTFIYRAIKCYKELCRVEDRMRSRCLEGVKAEATIKTVWEQIHQNPLWKLKISTRLMSCLIRDDLHMTAHQHSNRHLLTPALKEI